MTASLACMPHPRPNADGSAVDYDHYLDDLLFVQENRPWLEMCGGMLPKILQHQGYIISQKSQLEPFQGTTWLGKDIDLRQLSIGNSQYLRTRVFSALINIHGCVVRTKTVIRVMGLIGWLAEPKKGHLPFLAGVCTAVSYNRSEYIWVTGTFRGPLRPRPLWPCHISDRPLSYPNPGSLLNARRSMLPNTSMTGVACAIAWVSIPQAGVGFLSVQPRFPLSKLQRCTVCLSWSNFLSPDDSLKSLCSRITCRPSGVL